MYVVFQRKVYLCRTIMPCRDRTSAVLSPSSDVLNLSLLRAGCELFLCKQRFFFDDNCSFETLKTKINM